jgi:hypothetical protein
VCRGSKKVAEHWFSVFSTFKHLTPKFFLPLLQNIKNFVAVTWHYAEVFLLQYFRSLRFEVLTVVKMSVFGRITLPPSSRTTR